jgi:hypothetical protein
MKKMTALIGITTLIGIAALIEMSVNIIVEIQQLLIRAGI